VSYQSRQKKRRHKRIETNSRNAKRTPETAGRRFLIPAKKPGRCAVCGDGFKRGDDIVYRAESRTTRCLRCAGRADFDRMIAARGERDLGKGSHVIGRPAKRHALQHLAVCGCCGRGMHSWTSAYTRKDGGKQRTYRCPGYHEANDSCSATQFDAGLVDAAVLASLDELLPDFDRWIAQVAERHSGERERLQDQVDRARRERDEAARQVEVAEKRWLALDPADQDLVLGALRRARDDLNQAEIRVQATEAALASVPVDVGRDALLDFAASLQRALRGIDTSGSMAQVNAALGEVFSAFYIWTEDDAIRIEPSIHPEVAAALIEQGKTEDGSTWAPWLLDQRQGPPPLRWVPSANSDYSQESWHFMRYVLPLSP
jgi:recombinase-like zinc beta ribbon protein